jgi:hypothetical protein
MGDEHWTISFWRPHRSFLTGMLCGGVVIGLVRAALAWLNIRNAAQLPSAGELFPDRGSRVYDQCLVAQRGSTEACDAIMRMRDASERLKKE